MNASAELKRLHRKWISANGEPDVNYIQSVILRELRFSVPRVGNDRSAGLISEMRGELILCGKIRKQLAA